MPLPESLRSALRSVPALEESPHPPPSLRGSSAPQSLDLSHAQFDREDKIDEGGNAAVYRARVPERSLTVALKRPFPGQTVAHETAEQILSEADNWEKVDDHPYIASILDWGYEAIPWIAIEYLDGGPLTGRAGELSLHQRLWTAYAIVDAVAYATGDKGVAHHDLKPQNILFQQTPADTWDVPKIVDWGLSRELSQQVGSTSQSTPEYAAPEQSDRRLPNTPVGPYTDVYQLGVVCYELLTGEHPDHLYGTPSPPSAVDPAIPSAVDPVITGALAREPTARTEHPLLLRSALEDVLEETFLDTRRGGSIRSHSRAENPETASSHTPEQPETDSTTEQTKGKSRRVDTGGLSGDIQRTSATGSDEHADTDWFRSEYRPGIPPLSTAVRSVREAPDSDSAAEAIARTRPDPIGPALEHIDRSSAQ